MLSRLFAWGLFCFLVIPSSVRFAEASVGYGTDWVKDEPTVVGYVTRVNSARDFDVDGVLVKVTGDTAFTLAKDAGGSTTSVASQPQAPYLGQFCLIFGKVNGKTHSVEAREARLITPGDATVSGTGIIDRTWVGTGGVRRFRADGRVLEVSPAMLAKPAKLPAGVNNAASANDPHTNMWVDYKGVQRADGVVELETATFADNAVGGGEGKLRAKGEFDPAAVTEEQKQSAAGRFFLGQNYKRIPAYKNTGMQARVDAIGAKLIPAYQVALPETDVTKIHFRFQLVDEPRWRDAITLPSGIILVPWQIVDRLKNDSQLAAVLADNVATALEKQTFRQQTAVKTITAANVAGSVGGIFVPGLGLATSIGSWKAGRVMLSHAEQQSGRVALSLMDDAGYDITQAPVAWWTLKTKEARNGAETLRGTPPERATNQFQELGATWRVQLAKTPEADTKRGEAEGSTR